MGRPQEVQLDGVQDVHTIAHEDGEEPVILHEVGKGPADAAADISMPLAGDGASKAHPAAGAVDVPPTENGDHSSAAEEKTQEDAGPNYVKTEVWCQRYPESGAICCWSGSLACDAARLQWKGW